jgi:NAD dependent epimerase/dehydratase
MPTTVAVTGADGFIGSHLTETLVHSGYQVRAMVQYNSFGSWGWLESLDAETLASIEVVPGDVRDRDSVLGLMTGADMVCHLAALIAIPYSYQAPFSYLETNAGGTLNVLEAGRTLGTSRIVCTSTSEVYGSARIVPISEDHPLQAQSPYSASKIAADKLAESYHLSFDLPIITLRPFNTYGPRQSARAVIPTVISQLAAGKREIALGSLTPTRDFNFVLDTANAFEAMLVAPLEDVVAELMGTSVDIRVEDERLRPEKSEVTRLVSDSSAIQHAALWKSGHTLSEGLKATIEWFSNPDNLRRYKTDQYNV